MSDNPIPAIELAPDSDTGLVLPKITSPPKEPTPDPPSESTEPTTQSNEPAIESEVLPVKKSGSVLRRPSRAVSKQPWNPSTSIRSLNMILRDNEGPGIHRGLDRARKVYGNAFPKQRLDEADEALTSSGYKGKRSSKRGVSETAAVDGYEPPQREQAPRPSTYVHVSPATGLTASTGNCKTDFASTYRRSTLIGNWQEDRVLPQKPGIRSENKSYKVERLERGNVLGTSPGIGMTKLEESDMKRVSARFTPRGAFATTKPKAKLPKKPAPIKDSEALQALVRKPRQASYGNSYFWHISSIYHSDFKWPTITRTSVYNQK